MPRPRFDADEDFGPDAGTVPDDAFTLFIDDRIIGLARPSRDELAALAERGVTHLISLTVAAFPADQLEAHGLEGVHIPLPDMSAPTPAQIARFVETLSSLVADGRKVAVHCGAGLGRTGTMLACYLVSAGMRASEAIAAVRRRRPGSVESRAQEEAVAAYEAHLRP